LYIYFLNCILIDLFYFKILVYFKFIFASSIFFLECLTYLLYI